MTQKEQREKAWRERLAKQAGSGLSARAWCAREGVNDASFRRWRQRFGETQPQPASALTLVQIAGEPAAARGVVIAAGAAAARCARCPGGLKKTAQTRMK